jgi:formyl-CoA transferase
MFHAAMRAIGRPELIEDARFSTFEGRHENSEELGGIISDWTRARPKREVMAAFASRGVPCGAVFDTQEVITHPHLIERGMVQQIEHPVRGTYSMIGCPVRLSDSPVEITPAPLYGEDSDEVFTTLGGLTHAELAELRREKVIV